jgi:hypothetical protein
VYWTGLDKGFDLTQFRTSSSHFKSSRIAAKKKQLKKVRQNNNPKQKIRLLTRQMVRQKNTILVDFFLVFCYICHFFRFKRFFKT